MASPISSVRTVAMVPSGLNRFLGGVTEIFLFVGLTSSKNKEYPDTSFKSAIENVMYPAQPKAIFTQTYRDASKVVADIKVYSARGYIVKKCEGTSAGQGLSVQWTADSEL